MKADGYKIVISAASTQRYCKLQWTTDLFWLPSSPSPSSSALKTNLNFFIDSTRSDRASWCGCSSWLELGQRPMRLPRLRANHQPHEEDGKWQKMAQMLQKRANQDFQVRQNIAHQVYWLHKKCPDHWENVKTDVFEGCCFRGEEGGGWRGGDGDDEGEEEEERSQRAAWWGSVASVCRAVAESERRRTLTFLRLKKEQPWSVSRSDLSLEAP